MINKTYIPILITSVEAKEDLKEHRFIGFDGKYCKAGKKAMGVVDVTTEEGQMTPVAVLGVLLVEAAENIAVGDVITSDNYGRAVKVGTSKSNGVALDSGTKGNLIRIIRGI